ncbi:MAG: hypothetical protein ACFCUN_01725 [Hyphomicrobiaceae bacterium]
MPRLRAYAVTIGIAAVALAGAAGRTEARVTLSDADYRACQAEDDSTFEAAVRDVTRKALARGLERLDYEAIVRDVWRARQIGEIIDGRVDLAVAEVRSQSSWSSLLQSLAYRERAQELATAVAERVYRSEAVKAAIVDLAVGTGEEIGRSIEISTVDAAGPAQTCVRAFLGPRYGRTVAAAVEQDAGRAFALSPEAGAARVSREAVVLESAGGLTGAVILLVRRQLANMASRLGQRLVGAVLGRIVSVAAGGVGVALIAKDIWDLRLGMLPIIAEEMKSAEQKSNVQRELAAAIQQQIDGHVDDIAQETSAQVLRIWQSFKSAHTKVLTLAEANAEFRSFIDAIGQDRLYRLDRVVALILERDGPAGVQRALTDGRLHTAVTALSDAALDLAEQRRSLDDAIKWAALAGDRLSDVVDLGLHVRTSPEDFTRPALLRLLALQNRASKMKLAELPVDARAILFELDTLRLEALGRALSTEELVALASYLRGLEKSAAQSVLEAVAERPARMQMLASSQVRDWVLSSRDQSAAVALLLRDGQTLSPAVLQQDLQLVLDGRIHPLLIWQKHPVLVVGLGLLALLLLLLIRSVVFSGRKRTDKTPQSSPAA